MESYYHVQIEEKPEFHFRDARIWLLFCFGFRTVLMLLDCYRAMGVDKLFTVSFHLGSGIGGSGQSLLACSPSRLGWGLPENKVFCIQRPWTTEAVVPTSCQTRLP
jgi:hypothetical protein